MMTINVTVSLHEDDRRLLRGIKSALKSLSRQETTLTQATKDLIAQAHANMDAERAATDALNTWAQRFIDAADDAEAVTALAAEMKATSEPLVQAIKNTNPTAPAPLVPVNAEPSPATSVSGSGPETGDAASSPSA